MRLRATEVYQIRDVIRSLQSLIDDGTEEDSIDSIANILFYNHDVLCDMAWKVRDDYSVEQAVLGSGDNPEGKCS